jgi:putative photosynthetic complex assembly protein 2
MTLLSHPAVAAFCAVFLWWFSTGVVLYSVGPSGGGSRWRLLGAALVFAASLYGLAKSSSHTGVTGAYVAFTSALLLWGVQEYAFLAGFITGPRAQPCPDGCHGWRRTALAIEAILYHEVALLLSGLAVVAATWDAGNQFGTATFLVLWVMRLSAKLNLFVGVPVLNHEFLPKRMQYLASFFRSKSVSPLFPLAVTAATVVATLLVAAALSGEASAFQSTGCMLLASFMALGVLEHWFMVLPLPVAALWSWGTRLRAEDATGVSPRPLAKTTVPSSIAKIHLSMKR